MSTTNLASASQTNLACSSALSVFTSCLDVCPSLTPLKYGTRKKEKKKAAANETKQTEDEISTRWVCRWCPKTYRHRDGVRKHCSIHHKEKLKEARLNKEVFGFF
jgi:hypothetical protein